MAVIKAGFSQFPFHITDVAALLRLNIRRRGPDFLYVDCPLCGDHRGKLYLKTSRDVWHCNYCQEAGGMLALYAKVYGISNADAYREICEALQTGDYAPEYRSYQNRQPQEIAQSVRASIAVNSIRSNTAEEARPARLLPRRWLERTGNGAPR